MEQRIADIKKRSRANAVPLWQIARKIGVSEMTITRWLRMNLSPERYDMMLSAIDEILKERGETYA